MTDSSQSEFHWPAPGASKAMMEKIAKLLALAADPANEHEAALAAAKARELLDKYNLSVGDVELEASASTETRLPCSARPQLWFCTLLNLCEEHFQVKTIILQRSWGSCAAICGLGQNVEAAALTLKYLCNALNSLVKSRGTQLRKKGKRSVRANARRCQSYKAGAARRIARDARAVTASQSQAIVRISTAIAERHLERNYPGFTTSSHKAKADNEYVMGWMDGKKVNAFGARPQLERGGESQGA